MFSSITCRVLHIPNPNPALVTFFCHVNASMSTGIFGSFINLKTAVDWPFIGIVGFSRTGIALSLKIVQCNVAKQKWQRIL